jgi:hypothetical protein
MLLQIRATLIHDTTRTSPSAHGAASERSRAKTTEAAAAALLYPRRKMIWFFDKDGERLRYEITRDRVDHRYRVVITHPDGHESIEEVDEPAALIERSVALMNSLRVDGWHVG